MSTELSVYHRAVKGARFSWTIIEETKNRFVWQQIQLSQWSISQGLSCCSLPHLRCLHLYCVHRKYQHLSTNYNHFTFFFTFRYIYSSVSGSHDRSPWMLECLAVRWPTGKPYFSLYYLEWGCFAVNCLSKSSLPQSSSVSSLKHSLLSALVLFSLFSKVTVSFYKWKTIPVKCGSSKKKQPVRRF